MEKLLLTGANPVVSKALKEYLRDKEYDPFRSQKLFPPEHFNLFLSNSAMKYHFTISLAEK